jgi:hypothetical protein
LCLRVKPLPPNGSEGFTQRHEEGLPEERVEEWPSVFYSFTAI